MTNYGRALHHAFSEMGGGFEWEKPFQFWIGADFGWDVQQV